MGLLIALAACAGVALWAFKTGKIAGSRGGFRAGLRRGRNSHK